MTCSVLEYWDPWVRLEDITAEQINKILKFASSAALSGAASTLMKHKLICGNSLGYKLCLTDEDWEDIPYAVVRKTKNSAAASEPSKKAKKK